MEMRRRIDNKIVSRQFIDYFKTRLSISINRKNDYLSGGYPEQLFEDMWKLCDVENLKKDAKILVVNDYALECVYELLKRDFTNITILVTHERIMHTVSSCLNRYYKFPVSIEIIEFPEVCEMNKKFDLMIANPPYSCGNDVVTNCLHYCCKSVVLMPSSKFRNKKLYQHVKTYIPVSKNYFEDATVGKCNAIATLDENINFEGSWSLFCTENTYDKRYRVFYGLNSDKESTYRFVTLKTTAELNPSIDFIFCSRVCANELSKTNKAVDRRYNLLKDYSDLSYIPVDSAQHVLKIYVLRLNSEIEKNNFSSYWYNNSLGQELVSGLNKTDGTISDAIPKINWSIDRDYEHLTLDDLINILKEENK